MFVVSIFISFVLLVYSVYTFKYCTRVRLELCRRCIIIVVIKKKINEKYLFLYINKLKEIV